MYLAGFDVKDVHMTDLVSGRETLEDVNFIVFVGGFSNSDVLGSAKGWAGAFKYNEKARMALENFYKREDTLSLGICNGCQLMVELDLVYPEHGEKVKMLHNASHKLESAFLSVDVVESNSVLLKSLVGSVQESGLLTEKDNSNCLMDRKNIIFHFDIAMTLTRRTRMDHLLPRQLFVVKTDVTWQ